MAIYCEFEKCWIRDKCIVITVLLEGNEFTNSVCLILGLFVSTVNISMAKNPIQAQVGTEPEIFRVIMTIFGVDKSKGDVIAIITVNNGEASRVKLFESDTFPSLSANLSSMAPVPTTATKSNSGVVEYVATFPNVTVVSGQEYQACVITTQNSDLICKTGFNSPAARPEFVDLSLDTENTAREAVEEEE